MVQGRLGACRQQALGVIAIAAIALFAAGCHGAPPHHDPTEAEWERALDDGPATVQQKIVSGAPPHLANPRDAESFTQKRIAAQYGVLFFSWTWDRPGQRGTFELATDRNFTHIVNQIAATGNGAQLRFAEAGTYYWRIRQDDGTTSNVQEFAILEE